MEKTRAILPQLLRGSALIWHSTELSANEREMLRLVPLDYWYTKLIARFKERTSNALHALQVEKYTIADARERKSPRIYAQSLFRHAKAAQMTSVYNQLMIAWNNLDWRFRVHVPELKEDTTIQDFLDALDSKASIWKEMGKHDISSIESASKSRYIPNSGFRAGPSRSNQYPPRQSQSSGADGVTLNKLLEAINSLAQGQAQLLPRQYPQRQSNNTSYEQKQFRGRDTSYRPTNQNQFQIKNGQSTTSLPTYGKRQARSDQILESDKKSQKAHAFLHEEMEEGTDALISEEYDHQDANYYHSPELDYYEPDAFNQPEDPPEAFHIQSHAEPECRYCGSQFLSNNKLHNHLRQSCKGRHTAFTVSIGTAPVTISPSKKKRICNRLYFKACLLFLHPSIHLQI